MKRVAIVGGGVSGLTTAYLLQQKRPELELTLYEKDAAAGGKVRSSQHGGYTVDWGPNGFLTNVPETVELAKSLGLEHELQPASDVAKYRFLYKNGGLRPLPLSPPAFLKSELLSPLGKARAALEPLLGKAVAHEETVYDFLSRHFGSEVAGAFAGPFVLGITAGDAKELSLDALFPRFRALEAEHGSLVRALVSAQRKVKVAKEAQTGRLTSFRGGIGRLIDALREALGEVVRLGVSVRELQPQEAGYALGLSSGETVHADAVVLATPAFESAALLSPFLPEAAAVLSKIPYADVRVFGLGYDRVDVPNLLDGFGFLVPRGEGVRALGVLYSSSIFPDQAPKGKVLLRVIAGGSVDPEFAGLSDDEALAVVRRDLELTLGITAPPDMLERIPWPRGIPQYLLGHGARVETAMRAVATCPNLFLTGNAYYGVGVNDTVRDAHRVANLLARASHPTHRLS